MWEVKTLTGRRSSAHIWFSSDASNNGGATGTTGGGTCGVASGACDTDKFTATTNVVALRGRNDWRVPQFKELQSIAHFGVFNSALDGTWFPYTPASWFLAGSRGAGGATNAWDVDFGEGYVSIGGRSGAFRVRLVRAGQ